MKKELLYQLIIVTLLVINTVQIGYTLSTKNKRQKSNNHPKPDAVEILHLDEKQNMQFKEIGREHGKAMNKLRSQQKKCVESYFLASSDSLLNCIKDIEAEKIRITEEHFLSLIHI